MNESGAELLDRISRTAAALPGVVGLYRGPGAPVMHLPGQRLVGARADASGTRIALIAEYGTDLRALASRVDAAFAKLSLPQPISITIADVEQP